MATSIAERVEKGINWLTEHDPTGAFHLWFTSKITPYSPMPAQTPERIAQYRTYYAARVLWERLWLAMEKEEKVAEEAKA